MVEGPGCTKNGLRAQGHIGKRILGVNGRDASKVAAAARQRVLTHVLTLGKELWLIFGSSGVSGPGNQAAPEVSRNDSTAIRLHFGMSGSMLLDNTEPKYQGGVLTLGLIFQGNCKIRIYNSSASLEPSAQAVIAKHAQGAHRDVCAKPDVFDPQACLAVMASGPQSRLICDVLLDQAVLPGCGNIIKNEALHRARVHPLKPVGSISPADMLQLITEVRAYSLAWFRASRAPSKHVYNRNNCADCGGKVSIQKAGGSGHLQRVTFWCRACCGECSADASGRMPVMVDSAGVHVTSAKRGFADLTGLDDDQACSTSNMQMQAVACGVQNTAALPLPAAASCPTHGCRSIALRRTRKPGANFARLFFTCLFRGCSFFKWADTGFPRCYCVQPGTESALEHQKLLNTFQPSATGKMGLTQLPCVLRISKKENSGGSWFFSCAGTGQPRSKAPAGARGGCSFFCWADASQIEVLGPLLTPLS